MLPNVQESRPPLPHNHRRKMPEAAQCTTVQLNVGSNGGGVVATQSNKQQLQLHKSAKTMAIHHSFEHLSLQGLSEWPEKSTVSGFHRSMHLFLLMSACSSMCMYAWKSAGECRHCYRWGWQQLHQLRQIGPCILRCFKGSALLQGSAPIPASSCCCPGRRGPPK